MEVNLTPTLRENLCSQPRRSEARAFASLHVCSCVFIWSSVHSLLKKTSPLEILFSLKLVVFKLQFEGKCDRSHFGSLQICNDCHHVLFYGQLAGNLKIYAKLLSSSLGFWRSLDDVVKQVDVLYLTARMKPCLSKILWQYERG